jgi:acetyl-CoA acetyltransferase
MTDIVIAGYARSPFDFATKGALARVRPDDLAAQVIRGLIERAKVPPQDIEDIIVGCAFPEAEQGLNIGRLIGLLADLPLSVGGMTVNRLCGSSMQAIHIAAGAIGMGAGEAYICAGVESGVGAALARRVYRHGRDGRERRTAVADHPRRPGGVRGGQSAQGRRRKAGRQVRR